MGERVLALFDGGMKMIDIARELNISYNTVKSIIRRRDGNDKKEELKESGKGRCLYCGKEITLIEGKKKKIFCSTNCRVKQWRLKHGKRRLY